MRLRRSLEWPVEVVAAREQQLRLLDELPAASPLGSRELVGGLDVGFSRSLGRVFAVITVLGPDGAKLAVARGEAPLTFPYVPGLLSYREGPACCAAWEALTVAPDVLICDGQGVAHPLRFGLACHLGLAFGLPTLGSAKSLLVGRYIEPGRERGARSALLDPRSGERLGTVLRTRDGVKPLFVSVGAGLTLGDAEEVVLESCRGRRLPEPQRQAHLLVTRYRVEKEATCA